MPKYKITIGYDDCIDNPLDWDNTIKFACEHGRYKLGNYSLNELLHEYNYNDDMHDLNAIVKFMSQFGHANTLSMTEHGDLIVYVGSPRDAWDSGYIGIVFIPTDKVNDYKDNINWLIDTYNSYLNGELYYYTVEKYTSDGLEHVDSIGGYYDYNECKKCALECVPTEFRDNIEWVN